MRLLDHSKDDVLVCRFIVLQLSVGFLLSFELHCEFHVTCFCVAHLAVESSHLNALARELLMRLCAEEEVS